MNTISQETTLQLKDDNSIRPLKVALVREEFVELTDDPLIAIVLNQMVYWSQRVKDFDLFLEEEKLFNSDSSIPLRHGWIYKTAEDLIKETMLRVRHPTMRKYLKFLVDHEWLDERINCQDKWDKTTQYRVNIRKLQEDLLNLGYCLPGYSLVFRKETSHPCKSADFSNVKNLHSNEKKFDSSVRNFDSDAKNLHSYTYTETTTENTNREHTQGVREFQKNIEERFSGLPLGGLSPRMAGSKLFEEALALWKVHVGQETHLTQGRRQQLKVILNAHFQNDLAKWELFCKRIKGSPFLMGEGLRKWRISLDWVLDEENLIKVLEGNFDEPDVLEQQKNKDSEAIKVQKFNEIIDSIEDPVWKYWCSQLALSSKDALKEPSITISELEAISQAKFLEAENGKLIWIEAANQNALNHIESLRLELLSVVQRMFLNARNIRTRLQESEVKNQKNVDEPFASLKNESPNSSFLPPTPEIPSAKFHQGETYNEHDQ